MDYIGASVTHGKYGRGTIIDATDSYVTVSFDISPEEKRKFAYPQCFEHFLTLEDETLSSQAKSQAEEFREQEERGRQEEKRQLMEDTAALQRIIMPSQKTRAPKTKPAKRELRRASKAPKQQPDPVSEERKILTSIAGLEEAQFLSVSDPYCFAGADEVLKHVFHVDSENFNREYYRFENNLPGAVWFAKLTQADQTSAAASAAETWVITSVGKDLRMFTRSLSLTNRTSFSPLYVFARTPGSPLRFIGVYERDNERSGPRDIWFRQTSDTLDLSPWRQ